MHKLYRVRFPKRQLKLLTVALCVFIAHSKIAPGAEAVIGNAELVDFESARFFNPPSPFKLKLAEQSGTEAKGITEPGISLNGYLARPEGDGPWAAIVLLHSCAGITEHTEMWSQRLVKWGYVVLSVDSFSPRGLDYICEGQGGAESSPWKRALDAHGAKRYLASLPYVDPTSIAVFGISHGGTAVLEAIKLSTSKGLEDKPFKAAIALYPLCGQPTRINTPTLIFSGGLDYWSPAEQCEHYAAKFEPQQEITFKVFANAHHGFDIEGADIVEAGYIIRGNPEAAAETSDMTRSFLQDRLQ